MDPILERAALWGIETRYQDAFGRLRTVEPEMLVRLLGVVASDDAAAARMLPRTIVVRGERDRAVAVAAAEGQALRWEIAGEQTIAEGEGAAPSLTLPPGLPTGLFRLRVTAATVGRPPPRGGIARRLSGSGPSGRRIRATADVGAGRAALQRPLGAQLGPWRFHRSVGAGRACGRSRRLRRRAQSPACLVRRSAVGAEPLLPEQPAVSQSALHRPRRGAGISRPARRRSGGGGRAAARRGQGRLPRRGRRKDAGAASSPTATFGRPAAPSGATPSIGFGARGGRC